MLIVLKLIWAWVLPWAAPVLGLGSRLFARVRGGGAGHGWGLSVVVGVAAALALGLVLWTVLDRPEKPLLLTREQVELANLRAEHESLKAALAQSEQTLRERDRELGKMAEANAAAETELRGLRDQTNPDRRSAVALPPDDPWLRQWQSGAAKGRAAGAKGR